MPFFRSVLVAAGIVFATNATPALAGGACPPDVNNDSMVGVSDLLSVVSAWGQCVGSCQADIAPGAGDGVVNTNDLLAVLGSWGDCSGSTPPLGPLTPSGPISLGNGPATITNRAITGTFGILAGNDKHVTLLIVDNCTMHVDNAGIYASPCDQAIVTNTHIIADGQPNPYSVRGTFTNWTSSDCTFNGDKAWRIYGLTSGSSTRDTFTGGRLLCGGGSANEWEDPQDFDNFTFRDGEISVGAVEIHAASNNITFNHMDFSGTPYVSIHGPAHDITFVGCTHLPEIRQYDDPQNVRVLQ